MPFAPTRAALLAGAAALAAAAPAAAEPADEPSYAMRAWETDDGLPHNVVNAVLRRQDGFVWAATLARTVRFDGVAFTPLVSPLLDPPRPTSLRSLIDENPGTLLVAGDAAGLVRVRDGQATVHPLTAQIGGRRPMLLFRERDDVFWVDFLGREVWRWDHGKVEKFPPPPETSLGGVVTFAEDARGRMWLSRGAGLERYREGALERVPGLPPEVTVGSSATGAAWAATTRSLWRLEEGGAVPAADSVPWRDDSPPSALLESSDGALWVGLADHGLWRWASGRAAREPTSYPHITALAEDDEGGIWAGTAGGGLDRLQPARFSLQTEGSDWATGSAVSICEGRPGELWYTDRNTLFRTDGRKFEALSGPGWPKNPLPVCSDRKGDVWIASAERLFVARAGSSGPPEPVPDDARGHIHAIFGARDGSVWVGRERGALERFSDGGVERYGSAEGFDESEMVHAIGEDAAGRTWIGTLGGNMYSIEAGRMRRYGAADGLPGGDVRAIWGDAAGTVWIGTSGTGLLIRKDGRFWRVDASSGLPNNTVSQILEDGYGSLWLGTSRFLLRADKNELWDCARGAIPSVTPVVFGRADGISGFTAAGSYQPTAWRASSGRLWFATRKGLVTTDPSAQRFERRAPRAYLDRFGIDGRAWAAGARLPSQSRRYEFRFAAPAYAAPQEVRYRYRLDGLDSDWSDPTAERAATYSALPPGSYRFRVVAGSGIGRWNPEEASVAFEVLPAWWETWWARAGALALAAAGVGALVRLVSLRRLRARLERLEWRQRAEAERDRIARDLHDGLGASLTQVSLLAEEMCEDTDNVPDLKIQAGRLLDKVRTIARDLDGAVWAASPQHDTLASLGDYLSRFSLEFFRGSGIRCRVNVGALPALPLPPEIRHHLFMIAKESMHNALRHARATRVELGMTAAGGAFELSVADDGRGFDPAAASASGRNGLRNLRARASEAGGTVEIETSPGGTIVRVRLPLGARVPTP